MSGKGHLPSSRSQNDGGSGDDSRDDGERASDSVESSDSGRLPSQEGSSDGGRLPSQEKEGSANGKGSPSTPPVSDATESENASSSPSDGPTGAGPRNERIQRAIDTGGLDELPKDFGNPDEGDWQIVQSENPFEKLYLDYRRHEEITSEMVRKHFELISSFWKKKIQTLETGAQQQARQIRRKYGGPHKDGDVVRKHLEQTKQAYRFLKDAEGREQCYRELEKTRREQGREALLPLLRQSLRDGVLEPSEAEGLFEAGCEAGLRDEEVADFVKERLRSEGFAPVREPEGDSFVDHLRSVRWMTREKYQQLEDERGSADEQKPTTAPASTDDAGEDTAVEEATIEEASVAGAEGKPDRMPTNKGLLVGGGVLLVIGLLVGGIMLYPAGQRASSVEQLPTPKFSVATTADRLNVRAEPSVGGETLTQVPKGARLDVIGSRGDWYQVLIGTDAGRQKGWIHSEYSRRKGNREEESVASNQSSEADQGETGQGQQTSSTGDAGAEPSGNSDSGEREDESSSETSVPANVLSMDSPDELTVGDEVTFSANVNGDQVPSPLSYRWRFGDGETGTGLQVTHSYSEPGDYTIHFRASNQRTSDNASRTIKVKKKPLTSFSFAPEASASASMKGNRFTVTVVSGKAIEQEGGGTKVSLQVRQKSENFDGKWVRWGHILDESYLAGPRGRAYEVNRAESANLGSGRVQSGDTRTGRVVFSVDAPPGELDQVTLHFTYFPYREGRAVKIPFSIR